MLIEITLTTRTRSSPHTSSLLAQQHSLVTFNPCPSSRERTILVNAGRPQAGDSPMDWGLPSLLFRAVHISLPIIRGCSGRGRSPRARQNCSYLESGAVILSVDQTGTKSANA